MTDDIDDLEEKGEKFLLAFARSVLTWQEVERNLYLIFDALVRHDDHRLPSAAFHAVHVLRTRTAMVTAVAKILLDQSLFSKWKSLSKKITTQSKDRNKLAHFTLMGHLCSDGTVILKLAPSIFVVSTSPNDECNIDRIEEFQRSFESLSTEMSDFRDLIVQHLRKAAV
jgi:hypothetical protein